ELARDHRFDLALELGAVVQPHLRHHDLDVGELLDEALVRAIALAEHPVRRGAQLAQLLDEHAQLRANAPRRRGATEDALFVIPPHNAFMSRQNARSRWS